MTEGKTRLANPGILCYNESEIFLLRFGQTPPLAVKQRSGALPSYSPHQEAGASPDTLMPYVYILRCGDGTLYTGMTSDMHRRMRAHIEKTAAGAKYTRSHGVSALAMLWEVPTLRDARRLEAAIHQLARPQKEALIADPGHMAAFFPALAECSYQPLPERSLSDYYPGSPPAK